MQAINKEYQVEPDALIKSSWLVQGDLLSSTRRNLLILPQVTPQLIFYTSPNQQQLFARICLVYENSMQLEVSGKHKIIGFSLQPGKALDLIQIPEYQLEQSKGFLPLELFRNQLSAIIHGENDQERIDAVTTWFNQQTKIKSWQHAKFTTCLQRLYTAEFPVSIQQICDEMNISVRSLERWFNKFIGFSPVHYIKLIRLEHILMAMLAKPNRSFLDIAYDLGYADSSHFSRDFKTLTGYRPNSFRSFIKSNDVCFVGSIHTWLQTFFNQCITSIDAGQCRIKTPSICGGIDLNKEVI